MFETSKTTQVVPVGCVKVVLELATGDEFDLGWFHFRDLQELVDSLGMWGVEERDSLTTFEAADMSGVFELWEDEAVFRVMLEKDRPE